MGRKTTTVARITHCVRTMLHVVRSSSENTRKPFDRFAGAPRTSLGAPQSTRSVAGTRQNNISTARYNANANVNAARYITRTVPTVLRMRRPRRSVRKSPMFVNTRVSRRRGANESRAQKYEGNRTRRRRRRVTRQVRNVVHARAVGLTGTDGGRLFVRVFVGVTRHER